MKLVNFHRYITLGITEIQKKIILSTYFGNERDCCIYSLTINYSLCFQMNSITLTYIFVKPVNLLNRENASSFAVSHLQEEGGQSGVIIVWVPPSLPH